MARPGRKSAAQTPAPPSERIKGSSKNPQGTAASKKSASGIRFSAKVLKSLADKRDEHNSKYKRKASLPQLKAVYRRGLGAFSSSHRPTISGGVPNSRNAWAMARVNKFLMKLAGKKVKAAYVQDDDLMEDGGVTKKGTIEFMNWFAGWVKSLKGKMNIGMSIPNEFSQIKGVDDFVFLDVFEKIDQDIDAKPYLIEILSKADELGVSIVAEPIPRHNQFLDNAAKRKKIDRQYIIGYYSIFGFSLMDNGLMHRKPGTIMAGGAVMSKLIVCRACGWRWNTADSDESDKYVCHQCGFDNRTYYDADPIGKYSDGGNIKSEFTNTSFAIVESFEEPFEWNGEYEYMGKNLRSDIDTIYVPSKNIHIFLYEGKNAQSKIDEGEYDIYVGERGLSKYWDEKILKKYKGADKLIGELKARIDEKDKKLYLLTMTTKPSHRKKGVMSYIINTLRNIYKVKKEDVIFVGLTDQGAKFYTKGKYHLGGEMSKHLAPNGKPSNLTHEQLNDLINQGVVELKMFDTTPEHAKEYGLDSKRPLYLQRIYISKHDRLKGIGSKVIEYIIDYAKKNKHDTIFGHITQESEPNIDVIKSMLRKAGFNTIEANNDFYKTIETKYADGGLIAPNGKPSNLTHEQWHLVRTPEFKAWFGDWETQYLSKLVAQEDGRLIYEGVDIGILETHVVEDKVVEIDRLYIDDKYQKKGIGRASIKYVFDKYGCDKIIAYPHPKSDPFWLKSGVSNVTMEGYFEIPKIAYDCSKIVDDNGEPKVVYHGSRSQFTTFDLSKGGESNTLARVGFWFSPNEGFGLNFTAGTWWGDIKGDYGIEYAVFLSIKNPKVFVPGEPGELFSDSYERFKTDIYALAGQSARDANIGGLGMALNNAKQTINDYRSMLKDDGYDGILIKQTRFDKRTAGDLNDQIVALYPEQIKLADGSNVTFDGNNPDIRYDKGGNIEEEAQMYIDVISMHPTLERYQKYKDILKNKFDIDYDLEYGNNDEKLIDNANLNDLKSKDDFLNYDNYVKYANKIFKLRGLIQNQPNHIEGIVNIDLASKIGNDLGFKVELKTYSGYGNYAEALGDVIRMPNEVDINTFIHEIGHIFDHEYSKEYIGDAKNSIYATSLYYLGRSDEVFAENFMTYFISPDWLKNNMPNVYYELDEKIPEFFKKSINNLINQVSVSANPDIRYAKGGQVKPLAPNGKPSNLTPELYRLVRTPAFKAWFGDWENDPANASKVVDENGEPKIMWHNSPKLFTIFDPTAESRWINQRKENVIWFGGSNKVIAYSEGEKGFLYQCFLKSLKPIIVDAKEYDVSDFYYDEKGNKTYTIQRIKGAFVSRLGEVHWSGKKNDNDGVIFYNAWDNVPLGMVVAVPSPNQIKLADGSNVTFDPNNPDIRFDEGGKIDKMAEKLELIQEPAQYAAGGATDDCGCGKKAEDGMEVETKELPVGKLAKGLTIEQIARMHRYSPFLLRKNLKDGIKTEMEHTDDKDIAEAIALDHLYEDPEYYHKLKMIEKFQFGTPGWEQASSAMGGVPDHEAIEIKHYIFDQRDRAIRLVYSNEPKISRFMICFKLYEAAKMYENSAENDLEKNMWNEVVEIWKNAMNDIKNDKKYLPYKDEEIMSFSDIFVYGKGGLLYGNSHANGGIPLLNKSTNSMIEVEGGEGVLNKRSMQMTKKMEFEGEQLTACEIISKINVMGGGVKFKCSDVKPIINNDGKFA